MINIENILFTVVMILYFLSMILFFSFVALKKESFSRIGIILQICGLAIHTLSIIIRGINAGRLPMTNQYEFATMFAWGLSLISLVFIRRYHFPVLGAFSAPVTFLVIGYAAMQNKEINSLMPALRSNWLGIHVSTAIIAYGAFGVSFVLAIIFLFREKINSEGFWNQHVPDKEKLDMISYRCIALGFLFLTFTIITGAIWAERAWGSYWSWDPKETWSLITWIVYATYLHLRIRNGWKGKSASVFAVIGFICVIFTFIGVNTFLPGIHSYA